MELERPQPPDELIHSEGLTAPDTFIPAPDVSDWIDTAFLAEDGPLYTPIHEHLRDAEIAVLWTNAPYTKAQKRIVGQAEMPLQSFRAGRWARGRAEQQLREWFSVMPDFLLTFDAFHAVDCDDATFCALVDHELCHCAQAIDSFGMPKFGENGQPIFAIRGHDVSEFTSVVQRFGIQAAGPEAVDFVIAAAQQPEIGPAKLGAACGTCVRLAA